MVKENLHNARGDRILQYIQRRKLVSGTRIEQIRQENPPPMTQVVNTMNSYMPMVKQFMGSLGIDDKSGSLEKTLSAISDMGNKYEQAEKQRPKFTKKLKTAVRKQQKNRIRHALRDGIHPADILDYAHKYKVSDVYKFVAMYMSDEPGYTKYYELGLREGWYEPKDEEYQPKYVEPGLMETLAPALAQFKNIGKLGHVDTNLNKKSKTAIRKCQKNRLRHMIRKGRDIFTLAQYAYMYRNDNESFEYIMTFWPEDRDASPILLLMCDKPKSNHLSMQYLHLCHDKISIARMAATSYNADLIVACLKLCSPDEINEFVHEMARNTNVFILEAMRKEKLIPDMPKLMRIHNITPEIMTSYNSVISGMLATTVT